MNSQAMKSMILIVVATAMSAQAAFACSGAQCAAGTQVAASCPIGGGQPVQTDTDTDTLPQDDAGTTQVAQPDDTQGVADDQTAADSEDPALQTAQQQSAQLPPGAVVDPSQLPQGAQGGIGGGGLGLGNLVGSGIGLAGAQQLGQVLAARRQQRRLGRNIDPGFNAFAPHRFNNVPLNRGLVGRLPLRLLGR